MATVLEEFLVKLGFQRDETQFRRFMEGLGEVSIAIGKIGAALAGAAIAIGADVLRIGREFDRLNLSAQRTGTTVSGMNALAKAFERVGDTAEDAYSAAAALRSFRINSPAWEQFMQSVGVQTRDKEGHIKPNEELLIELGENVRKKFGTGPAGMAMMRRMFGAFGLSEEQMLTLTDPRLRQQFEHFHKLEKPADLDELGRKSTQLMQDWSDFKTKIEALHNTLANQLMPTVDGAVKLLSQFADKLYDIFKEDGSFNKFRKSTAASIDSIADSIFKSRDAVYAKIGALFTDPELWNRIKGTFVDAFARGYKPITDLFTSLADIFSPTGFLLKGINLFIDIFKNQWVQYVVNPLQSFSRALEDLFMGDNFVGRLVRRYMGYPEGTPSPHASSLTTDQQKANAARLRELGKEHGLTDAQMSGVIGSGMVESKLDPLTVNSTGHAGLFQWDAPRQAEFRKLHGHGITEGKDPLKEQFEFMLYEMQHKEKVAGDALRAAQNATQAGKAMFKFERSEIGEMPYAEEAYRIHEQYLAWQAMHGPGTQDWYGLPASKVDRGLLYGWGVPGQGMNMPWAAPPTPAAPPQQPANDKTSMNIDNRTNVSIAGVADPHDAAQHVDYVLRTQNAALQRLATPVVA